MVAAGTLYVPGTSRIHRAHPHTKLSGLLFTGVAVHCLPHLPITAGGLLAIGAGLAGASGVWRPSWAVIWRTLLPLALFMIPIHGTLHPENRTPLFCVQTICLHREGVFLALSVLLKLLVILQAALLFVLTTHPADLVSAISASTGSPFLAYLVGSPLMLLPAMRERIRAIQSAQQARGMETSGSLPNRCRGLFPLMAPFILGSIAEVQQRAVALELRGISAGGRQTVFRQLEDSAAQRIFRRLLLLFSGALLLFGLVSP